jgi:hypothetical protein
MVFIGAVVGRQGLSEQSMDWSMLGTDRRDRPYLLVNYSMRVLPSRYARRPPV